MSARRRKRRKPPRLRVNVHKPSEFLAWANYWGCTQQNVRDAVKISGVMVEDVEDWLKSAFKAALRRADALMVLASPLLDTHAPRIVELAIKTQLPTMFGQGTHVESVG